MTEKRLHIFLVVLTCGTVPDSPVQAQAAERESGRYPARIVIVSLADCCKKEAWIEVENLAEAELRTLGFEVKLVQGKALSGDEWKDELIRISEEMGAMCTLRIIRPTEGTGGGAHVWMINANTGKSVYKKIPVKEGTDAEAASIVALQVVELFRASQFESNNDESKQVEQTEPTEPSIVKKQDEAAKNDKKAAIKKIKKDHRKPSSSKRAQDLGIRLGMEALGSPDGVGGLGAINLGIRWNFHAYLAVELDGLVTLIGEDLKKDAASASFDVAVVRSWFLWRLYNKDWFRSCMGIGSGALIAWSEGSAPEDYETQSDWTVIPYIGGTLQFAVVLFKYLWIRCGFIAGSSFQNVYILMLGEKVAEFGAPLLEGFVNLEIRFP